MEEESKWEAIYYEESENPQNMSVVSHKPLQIFLTMKQLNNVNSF